MSSLLNKYLDFFTFFIIQTLKFIMIHNTEINFNGDTKEFRLNILM